MRCNLDCIHNGKSTCKRGLEKTFCFEAEPTEDKMSDNEKCQPDTCKPVAYLWESDEDILKILIWPYLKNSMLSECSGSVTPLYADQSADLKALQDKIAELERSLIYLAYSWDMEEDKKHKQAKEMHHCCYKAEGTTYGICAAQLCDAIDKARK